MKQNNEYVIDKELLESTDYYVCHMKLPSLDKTIALVNPYHPSSPYHWYPEKTFCKVFENGFGRMMSFLSKMR